MNESQTESKIMGKDIPCEWKAKKTHMSCHKSHKIDVNTALKETWKRY